MEKSKSKKSKGCEYDELGFPVDKTIYDSQGFPVLDGSEEVDELGFPRKKEKVNTKEETGL